MLGKDNPSRNPENRRKQLEGLKHVIHHINGDHSDDRPENRATMTQSEHISLHNKQGDTGFKKGNSYGKMMAEDN